MTRVTDIVHCSEVRAALESFALNQESNLELILAIQKIPAPTFAEEQRAVFVEAQMRAEGLVDVHQDELFNVYGRLPGIAPATTPRIVISAHSDTVFPIDTDLTIKRDGKFIYGPGIGDNATGVAGVLLLIKTLQTFALRPRADLWFVVNVCEEGMGNLRGMRAVVDKLGQDSYFIVVEGGMHGQISHKAIGSRRFRIVVEGPGGHSWGDFGRPSAIHEIANLIVAIDSIAVPQIPKTTYNIGRVEGGISINTIAANANFLLDLRSEDAQVLEDLTTEVKDIIERAVDQAHYAGLGITITMQPVGNRPAGSLNLKHPLVRAAEKALLFTGMRRVSYINSSTDANIPLSRGIPAVCIGLTVSGNAHRLDEYIDPTFLSAGLQQLLLLTLTAANFECAAD